jgi:hypothetical protein
MPDMMPAPCLEFIQMGQFPVNFETF